MIDVEPLIVSELERMLPPPDGTRADWTDVLQRAGLAGVRRWSRGRPPVTEKVKRRRWRLVGAAAAVALLLVGAAYAAGFNPFAGISAADHPATSEDTLPAFLVTDIAHLNPLMEKEGQGHLLVDSARFISQLPSGMRFYTIATSAGELCLANVYPEGSSNAKGALGCGDSLNRGRPITIGSQQPDPAAAPPVNYGLAMDGVAAVSFMAGGVETTVPVKDNVWAYEGQANLDSVTVHWADGTTQTLVDGR